MSPAASHAAGSGLDRSSVKESPRAREHQPRPGTIAGPTTWPTLG